MKITLNNTGNDDLYIIKNNKQIGVYSNLSGFTNTTWSELKTLRDSSGLTAGQFYRITDYATTTTQVNTQSAGHAFDVIVRADETNKLNENATAAPHSGDTYFSGSNLTAWELKYCLDNINWSVKAGAFATDVHETGLIFERQTETIEVDGTTYYLWYSPNFIEYPTSVGSTVGYLATLVSEPSEETQTFFIDINTPQIMDDYAPLTNYQVSTTDGKGTITYMKDEFNNEFPYDFKNIQFKRWKAVDSASGRNGLNNKYFIADTNNIPSNLSVSNESDFIWAYTFSSSSAGGTQTDNSLLKGNNIHDNVCKVDTNGLNNIVFYGISNYGNTFGNNCGGNTFGNSCGNNSFGNGCNNNTFGNNCYNNSFGNSCGNNSFGYNCYRNSFGNSCYNNSFGNECYSNSFGNSCYYNSFGIYFQYNSFGNDCYSNSFGNSCYYNSFGNSCHDNSFGNSCYYNSFGNGCQSITFSKDYCDYNIVEDGNKYITLTSTQTTSSSNRLRNITIAQGVNNTTTRKTISHNTVHDVFKTTYQKQQSKFIDLT